MFEFIVLLPLIRLDPEAGERAFRDSSIWGIQWVQRLLKRII